MKEVVAFLVSRPLASAALIAAMCAVLYSNSLNNGFQYDDRHSIVENPHIRDLGNVARFFSHPEYFSRDPDKAMVRPVLLATLAANYAWSGYETYSYHFVNIILHGLCAVLSWAILRQLGTSPCLALFGGLLFAAHPICTEPVNYISARSELLAAAAIFGSFWLYGLAADSLRQSRGGEWQLRLGSVALFAVGLGCKSVAIVLPPLLLCRDFSLGQLDRHRWKRYLPYGLIAAAYLLYMKSFLLTALIDAPVRSSYSQLATQIKAIPYYFKILIIPAGLSVHHSFSTDTFASFTVVASLAALTSLLVWTTMAGWGQRYRLHLLGLGWMAITLAPTFVVPLNVLVNEHRLYLPLLGFVITLVGVPRLESVPGMLRGAPVAIILFGILVLLRNPAWSTEWTLWKDVSRKSGGDALPYVYMANYAKDGGQLENAVGLFEKALERDSGNIAARNNLANTYRQMGDWSMATRVFGRILDEQPANSDVRYNLARTYQAGGERDLARTHYLAVDPTSIHHHLALNNVGTLYEREGRLDSAVYYYRAALASSASSPDGRRNLSRVQAQLTESMVKLHEMGEFAQAESVCRQLLQDDPEDRDARFLLAVTLYYMTEYDESIEETLRLVESHPAFGEGLLQLANVMETAGRPVEAKEAYEQLLQRSEDTDLRREVRKRMRNLSQRMERVN